jgi:hypothetical protein
MTDDVTLTALKDRLAEVRDSVTGVRMTRPASEIFASAHKRRSRRVLAAAAAACAAISIALALTLPGSQARPVHVHLAAWSVDTNPDGTVTFKLHNTSQPARLQHVLAQAGVPAMVRQGEICLAQGRRVLLPTQGIVSSLNGRPTPMGSVFLLMGGDGHGGNQPLNWAWTINPSKIPTGTRFVISAIPSYRVSPSHIQAAWEFVPTSAPMTCAKSVKPS